MPKKGIRDVDVNAILSYVRRGFKIRVIHTARSQLKSIYFRTPDGCGGVYFDVDEYTRYALQKILNIATVAEVKHLGSN